MNLIKGIRAHKLDVKGKRLRSKEGTAKKGRVHEIRKEIAELRTHLRVAANEESRILRSLACKRSTIASLQSRLANARQRLENTLHKRLYEEFAREARRRLREFLRYEAEVPESGRFSVNQCLRGFATRLRRSGPTRAVVVSWNRFRLGRFA